MLKFTVDGQKLELLGDPHVVADSFDFLTGSFKFYSGHDWELTEKHVFFQLGEETPYEVILVDDQFIKTDHVNLTNGTWNIYVIGYDIDGATLVERITTNKVSLTAQISGVPEGEPFPPSIIPDVLIVKDQTTPQTFENGVPRLAADRVIDHDNEIVDKKHVEDTVLQLDQTAPQTLTAPPLLNPNRVIDSAAQMVDKKYVDQYALGGSGFAANLYFTTIDSAIADYKKVSYTAEATETELTIPTTTTEILARTYLFDAGLGTSVIDGGKWSATYRARASAAQGAYIRMEAFLRHSDNTETTLFSATSSKIVNTAYETLEMQVTQPSFQCATTDRLGFRMYASTTHPAGITLYTIVGDGTASYVNTPIALRHSQLRDLNGDVEAQHMTAAEKTALDGIGTTVSGAISTHNDDAGAHAGQISQMSAYQNVNFNAQGDINDFPNPFCSSLDKTTIDNFENINLWTITGTVANDTTNYIYGTRGIKLTSVNGATAQISKNISIDLTDKLPVIHFYVDDVTKLSSAILYVQTGGSWVKYLYTPFTEYANKLNNGWNTVVLNLAYHQAYGGITQSDLSNVTAIRLKTTSTPNQTVNVTFDMMWIIPNPMQEAIVTITFDDGHSSIYTEALPYMGKYGMRGVAYIIPNLVGGSGGATLDQLRAMYSIGWDISSHSYDHQYLGVGITDVALVRAWGQDAYDWLVQNGFTRSAEHFAYPGGNWNVGDNSTSAIDILKTIYSTCRLNNGLWGCLPAGNPHKILARRFSSGDQAAVIAAIDRAIAWKEWVVLMLHDVSVSPTIGPTTTEFRAVIDYINTNNVKVMTMSEVKRKFKTY